MDLTELKRAYDLVEARDYFIQFPRGPVLCIRRHDCEEKICQSYDAALYFYEPGKNAQLVRAK